MENVRKTQNIGDIKKELSTHLSFDSVAKKVNKKIESKELSIRKIPKPIPKEDAKKTLKEDTAMTLKEDTKTTPKDDTKKVLKVDLIKTLNAKETLKLKEDIKKPPKLVNIIVKKSDKNSTEDSNYYQRQSLSISQCRMDKFMSMTAADLPTPSAKKPACLNPVLKTPKDTLRCVNCNVLYDPSKKKEHLLTCNKVKAKVFYYGCAQCSYKSLNKNDIAPHVKETHEKK